MNTGAHLVMTRFPGFETAREVLSQARPSDWIPTVPDGPYKTDGWRVIKVIDKGEPTEFLANHPELNKALDFFQCKKLMVVYYSMLPGCELHPHRDLSATLEFGRLRFHIPVETNPGVKFMVAKKQVPMKPGEMWALNTSYLHAVDNHGTTDRVHFVVEVEANDWCWSLLPKKTTAFYAHYAFFIALIGWKAVSVTLTNPAAARYRLGMAKFLLSRFFKRGEANR